jgi:uncharacterized protein GlcG (DUF336 family)
VSGPGDTRPEAEGHLLPIEAPGEQVKILRKFRGDCLRLGKHLHRTDLGETDGIPQMPLSLKEAQTVIELARVHAEQIGVPMNIAVVDGGGHLLAFARMDKSILGSIDIALKKAKTSVLFNNPSESLWEFCKPGGPAPATEGTNGGLIPYAGGVPIRDADGSLVGAVGVSGGMPAQDGEVARAGLEGRP